MDCPAADMVQDSANQNKKSFDSKGAAFDDEVKEILEIISNTGKFWHHWHVLKTFLSYRLKQVLAEYPESQEESATKSQESSLSPETYPGLVKALDEALLNFTEGPPFTLQRLCEILLDPKSTYPKLSKLALALEKNLLVTSTVTICTGPYPGSITRSLPEENRIHEEAHEHISLSQNGEKSTEGTVDEEMVDVVAGDDNKIVEIDMQDKKEENSDIHGDQIEPNAESGPAKPDADA